MIALGISSMIFHPILSRIWNFITPIKIPTYFESEAILAFTPAFGMTAITWLSLDISTSNHWLLISALFLSCIPNLLIGYIAMRFVLKPMEKPEFIESSKNLDHINDTKKLKKKKMLAMAASIILFNLVNLSFVIAWLWEQWAPGAIANFTYNYLVYCSSLSLILLVIFCNEVLSLGHKLVNKYLRINLGEKKLNGLSHFTGILVFLTIVYVFALYSKTGFSWELLVENWSLLVAYVLLIFFLIPASILFGYLAPIADFKNNSD